jgi:hypothetical protein
VVSIDASHYTERLLRLPPAYFPGAHRLLRAENGGGGGNGDGGNGGSNVALKRAQGLLLGSNERTIVLCNMQSVIKISSRSFDAWIRILVLTEDEVSVVPFSAIFRFNFLILYFCSVSFE